MRFLHSFLLQYPDTFSIPPLLKPEIWEPLPSSSLLSLHLQVPSPSPTPSQKISAMVPLRKTRPWWNCRPNPPTRQVEVANTIPGAELVIPGKLSSFVWALGGFSRRLWNSKDWPSLPTVIEVSGIYHDLNALLIIISLDDWNLNGCLTEPTSQSSITTMNHTNQTLINSLCMVLGCLQSSPSQQTLLTPLMVVPFVT